MPGWVGCILLLTDLQYGKTYQLKTKHLFFNCFSAVSYYILSESTIYKDTPNGLQVVKMTLGCRTYTDRFIDIDWCYNNVTS